MTTKTVNIILAALAAILLLKIYNEDKEIKRLTKHVENVSQNSSEPPVSSSIHASADSATAPLQTSSAPTTHSPAKPTIVPPSQEEISKILQRAKHDLVIAEAFKNNCNAGGGYGNIEIKSQEDCDKFWRSIESRDDMLKRHTQYLNQIVSQLDFSATSDDDKAILDK